MSTARLQAALAPVRPYAIFVAAVGVFWWVLVASGQVASFILPEPQLVLVELTHLAGEPQTYAALGTTLYEIGVASALAAVAGVAIGVPVGWYKTLRHAYEPLLANIGAIPLIVLYPIFVLALGLGVASKIAFGAIYALFPIAIATAAAVATIDANLVSAARSMGATGGPLLRKVIIPAVIPQIISGMRVGVAFVTLAVVGGEFIGGTQGLGYRLAAAGQAFETVEMYAFILITVGLVAVLYGLLTGLDVSLKRRLYS